MDDPPETMAAFAERAHAVAATASKARKVALVAEYLAALRGERLALAARYFGARVFPPGDGRQLSIGGVALSRALLEVTGASEAALSAAYRRWGDAGDTAAELLAQRGPPPEGPLDLLEVDRLFGEIAAGSGAAARGAALTQLLRRCRPEEGRYAVKLIAGELRIGLREGLVEEAIAVAYGRPAAEVARALMLLGDLGAVACLVAAGDDISQPRYFAPLRFMLASPVIDAAEAVRRLGDEVWVEDKYDGIRCQLHRHGGRVALYSRDLNDVTSQFPEVVGAAGGIGDVILDGEILAFREGRVLPFQDLQTRLGRLRPSGALIERVPVIYVAWDLLVHGERSLLDVALRERRAELEGLHLGAGFALAHREPAVGSVEVERRFADARARRNEGLLIKDPESAYTPGRRGLAWLKLKRPLDTLDVVVVAAEWGHGRRRGVLSDVTFAVRAAGEDDDLVPIGKAYTGLTDSEIEEMTALLLEITTEEHGHVRNVRPLIVLEVAFDAVQPSTRHRSGYALRFPRIARWRHDKPVDEIDTIDRVAALAAQAAQRAPLIDAAG